MSSKQPWPRHEELITLHGQGWNNRQIGEMMGLTHQTVRLHLKDLGLYSNGPRPKTIEMVNETEAKCSKCSVVSSVENFQLNHRSSGSSYRYSFCRSCMQKLYKKTRTRNIETFLQSRLVGLRLRCKKKNIVCDLTLEDLIRQFDYQGGLCFYTDESMEWGGDGRHKNTLSFDRVMSHLGYIRNNVVFCGMRINTIKQDITPDEMQRWMPDWHARTLVFLQEAAMRVIEDLLGQPRENIPLWKAVA